MTGSWVACCCFPRPSLERYLCHPIPIQTHLIFKALTPGKGIAFDGRGVETSGRAAWHKKQNGTYMYIHAYIYTPTHTDVYTVYIYISCTYACSVYLYIHRSSIITLDDSISRTFWGPPTQFPAFSIGEPPWLQFYVYINVYKYNIMYIYIHIHQRG